MVFFFTPFHGRFGTVNGDFLSAIIGSCFGVDILFLQLPIGSMYGIYANIGGILMVNVTIYSIHGSYRLCNVFASK